MSAPLSPEAWAHWLTQQVASALYAVYVLQGRVLGFGWPDAHQLIDELHKLGVELIAPGIDREDES